MSKFRQHSNDLIETEIGRIPGDWDLSKLADIAQVIVSNVDKKFEENEPPVLLCNYLDVYQNEYITSNLEFMRGSASEAEIEKFSLRRGDVLITKDSETAEDIASAAVLADEIQNLICGYHLAILRPDKERMDSYFLAKTLQHDRVHNQFVIKANGVTRYGLTLSVINNATIPVPPLIEQAEIARILSTWDRAIEQVQRLIEAKQQQKKGLMQGLLTGRLRFSEFGEPVNREEDMPIGWQKFRLRELVAFYNGFGFPELNQGKSYGEIPFIKVSDMLNPGNHKYIFSSNNYVSSNTMETKGWKTAPTSSIVFAKVGEALYKNRRRILAQDTILDNNMMAIKAIPTRIADLYLYYIMLLVDFSKIAFPGALPSVNQKELGNEQIMLPGLPEQRKIISVLDRADTEIDLINNTLALLRQQKKGLMQKLLTGEIRVKVV